MFSYWNLSYDAPPFFEPIRPAGCTENPGNSILLLFSEICSKAGGEGTRREIVEQTDRAIIPRLKR